MSETILQVKNLKTYFYTEEGVVPAVDGLDFTLNSGETLAIVGESGCGKSTTGKTIVKLLRPTDGHILFEGKDIFAPENKEDLTTKIQIIFQDPYSSLDPRFTVGRCISEPMVVHKIGTPKEREERVRQLMNDVGLRPEHYTKYPHEFSGGQRQRIGLARAMVMEPELVVADEPISALDVSIRAQVLNLLKKFQKEIGRAHV